MKTSKTKILVVAVVGIVAMAGVVLLYQSGLFAREKPDHAENDPAEPGRPKLIHVDRAWFADKEADPGLKLTAENIKGLRLITAEVVDARTRPLPPQVGTLNYDNETMFLIQPRFNGELATMLMVQDKIIDQNGYEKIIERPIKFGDKVKQGAVLAVFWSQTLGVAKAALVDAVCSLRLSETTLARLQKLSDEGALANNTLEVSKRQVQSDSLAVLTAERTLRMWKLNNDEIKAIKDEANMIQDTKKVRDAALEAEKWARTEVIVPWFDKAHPERELTVLEKNTNIGQIVDNTNFGTWLFRVGDMSQLQIWVHPPEEYLPLIREGMKKNGGLQWEIRFQAEPDAPPQILRVDRIAPSLEPNQHNPMVIGYMPNVEHKYLAGQFVTATIHMPPEPDTVEIPTDAVNELKGQAFVFVKDKGKEGEFSLRRVAVVRRYADFTIVRSKLREQDRKFSADEVRLGRYPLRTIERGEQVVTRGVVELTTALENLITKETIKLQQ
jgi:membrane fusion protein, heavy metal efflux system